MYLWTLRNFMLLSIVWLYVSGTPRQFCGSDLADVMSLVCQGRGYNMAFKAESTPSERRYKRGIVDECCRRGCSWSTLETYCSPASSDLQIRKRSEFSSKWQAEIAEPELKKADIFKYDTSEIKIQRRSGEFKKWKLNIFVEQKIADGPNQLSRNREPVSNSRGPSVVNKVKRNDIEEGSRLNENPNDLVDSVRWKDLFNDGLKPRKAKSNEEKDQDNSTNIVSIRHHHKKSDMGRKFPKGKGINFSQIGTVPPYFQGRTLVLPPRQH